MERAYLPPLMVDHDVVRFHIPMHNAFGMAKIQSLTDEFSRDGGCGGKSMPLRVPGYKSARRSQ